jgi:hypothetical protein
MSIKDILWKRFLKNQSNLYVLLLEFHPSPHCSNDLDVHLQWQELSNTRFWLQLIFHRKHLFWMIPFNNPRKSFFYSSLHYMYNYIQFPKQEIYLTKIYSKNLLKWMHAINELYTQLIVHIEISILLSLSISFMIFTVIITYTHYL